MLLSPGPRALRDPALLEELRTHSLDMHVRRLTYLAQAVRRETGRRMPQFDPQDAGVQAKTLLLFDASTLNEFASLNADDDSSALLHADVETAGLPRTSLVLCREIPARYVEALLELLEQLRSVVLLGGSARRTWWESDVTRPDLTVFNVAQPTDDYPEAHGNVVRALREAHRLAGA